MATTTLSTSVASSRCSAAGRPQWFQDDHREGAAGTVRFCMSVLERFLRYVQVDTQSDETSETYPSTDKQLVLLRDLADELRSLGLEDAHINQFGYVMATIPANS